LSSALWAEVSKAKISLREGRLRLVEMPMPVAVGGAQGLAAPLAAVLEPAVINNESWRSGRDLTLLSQAKIINHLAFLQ
jgi:hypothetical protein